MTVFVRREFRILQHWVVSRANQYHALTPSFYQGAWNVMERSFEHEIIPMQKADDILATCVLLLAKNLLIRNGSCPVERSCWRGNPHRNRRSVDSPEKRDAPSAVQTGNAVRRKKPSARVSRKLAPEIGAKHITSG